MEALDPTAGVSYTSIDQISWRISSMTMLLSYWGEQSIPHPGSSWQPEGQPARRPHEYLRGETAKLLTLFRPATGEVRAQAVEHGTNAVLHPWLKGELEAILQQCPASPGVVPQSRRWQDWRI